MKVRATARGHYSDQIFNEGDQFEIDPDHFATWFEPVDEKDAAQYNALRKQWFKDHGREDPLAEEEKPKRGRPRKSETEEAPE